MRPLSCLTILALLAGSLAARADDAAPDPFVFTATRIPTPADDIPAGVTFIDRATIDRNMDITLSDALATVPGVHVVPSGGPGAQTSLFVRGTNSEDVLVLRDGVPINDPSDPNDAFDFGGELLADVERIEVIRGPLAGLYGSGAIGGVVNIISRQGAGAPGGTVTGALGYPFASLGSVTAGGRTGAIDYSASLEGNFDTGFDVTPLRESGVYTGERDGFRSWLGAAQLGYSPDSDTRVSLIVRSQRSTTGLDNSGYLQTFDDPNYTGYGESWFGKLGLTKVLLDGAWTSNAFASWQQSNRLYTNLLNPADPNQETDHSSYDATRYDYQWNNTLRLADAGPLTTNRVTFGGEYALDRASSGVNSADLGAPYASSVNAHEGDAAGYAGVETTLARRLTLDANLRGTDYSIAGSAVTWRAGGVLALPEIWSRLKASGGSGFLGPSLFDLYGVDSYGFHGNPSLLPERSIGWDVGWEIDLPLAARRDAATFGVTYFDTNLTNLITVPVDTPVNVGRARATGVEVVLTLRPAPFLSGTVSYTYVDARDLDTGALLLRRPQNQASANLAITPLPGVTISPQVVYAGAFQDYLIDNNGFSSLSPGLSPGGTLVNLTVSWKAREQLTLFARGSNILNARYEAASGFAVPGASMLAGATVGF